MKYRLIVLLFCSFKTYSFDKFDAVVCDAGIDDSARVVCYRNAVIYPECQTNDAAIELNCYKDKINLAELEKKEDCPTTPQGTLQLTDNNKRLKCNAISDATYIAPNDYSSGVVIYSQLVEMEKDNEFYRQKLDYFTAKLAEYNQLHKTVSYDIIKEDIHEFKNRGFYDVVFANTKEMPPTMNAVVSVFKDLVSKNYGKDKFAVGMYLQPKNPTDSTFAMCSTIPPENTSSECTINTSFERNPDGSVKYIRMQEKRKLDIHTIRK